MLKARGTTLCPTATVLNTAWPHHQSLCIRTQYALTNRLSCNASNQTSAQAPSNRLTHANFSKHVYSPASCRNSELHARESSCVAEEEHLPQHTENGSSRGTNTPAAIML